MSDYPETAEVAAMRVWVFAHLWNATVADARAAWAAGPYAAGTLTLHGPSGVVDEQDDQYDAWFLGRINTYGRGASACSDPTGNVDAQITEARYYPRTGGTPPTYVTASGLRLYHSGDRASSGDSDEALAAPGLGGNDVDAAWDYVAANIGFAQMMYATPQNTVGGGGNWSGGTAAGYVALESHTVRIGFISGLLDRIQAGGSVRQQCRASARSGIGVCEECQEFYATWCGRIYRPSSSSFVATLWDVGDWVGTTKWSPYGTAPNRTFRATAAAYAGCEATDYLVIESGAQFVGPTDKPAGCGIHFDDQAASDLPEEETSTDDLNSWVEFCDF